MESPENLPTFSVNHSRSRPHSSYERTSYKDYHTTPHSNQHSSHQDHHHRPHSHYGHRPDPHPHPSPHHHPYPLQFSNNFFIKPTSSGRIAKIFVHENHTNHRPLSPSRHDTNRTSTGLKTYPKSLESNKKFKLGIILPIQRRSPSPVKGRMIEISKNFTPKMKDYKSIHPKWKC